MINNCKVYGDETLNASDHVPINVNISYNITRYEQCSRKSYRWHKCDKTIYQSTLNDELCKDNTHIVKANTINNIDVMLSDIQNSVMNATIKAVPSVVYKGYRRLYWDEDLKAAHARQKHLRSIWIAHGQPCGRQFLTFLQYKSAKSEFRRLLLIKQIRFRSNECAKIDANYQLDSKSIWKHLRHHKFGNEPNTLHRIKHDVQEYSSPD